MTDEPTDNITDLSTKRPARPRGARKPPPRPVIAVIPPKEIPEEERLPDLDLELPDRLQRREIALVNMILAGAPFHEVAAILEYPTVAAARADYQRALAITHNPGDWETLRQTATARAEAMFRKSFAMASADYLIDMENPDQRVPNLEKLRWHEQAGRDLMNHAIISGAKAPTRLEITPSELEYDQLVAAMLTAQGHAEPEEADVVQIYEVTDGQEP